MRKASIAVFAAMSLLITENATAQDDSMDFSETGTTAADDSGFVVEDTQAAAEEYPLQYSDRPLVLNKGQVRGTFRLNIGGAGGGATQSSLDFGGAVSPYENLEVGISSYKTGGYPIPFPMGALAQGLITIQMSPNARYGDIPVYARYVFFDKKDWQLGADTVFVLPANTNFAWVLGMPVRYRGIDNLAIDTAFLFALKTGPARVDIFIPAKFTYNIKEPGFIYGATGIGGANLGNGNNFVMPLSFGGGYSMDVKDKILMDIFGEFGFQPLVTTNTGGNAVNASGTWYLSIGLHVTTDPLWD